jgi:hypothetical protein
MHLLVHTLVSVPRYDRAFAASLLPDVRAVYEQARMTCSVAELSAASGMSLGVTRVVLDDLATNDRLVIHANKERSSHDMDLLERLRDGLRKLA